MVPPFHSPPSQIVYINQRGTMILHNDWSHISVVNIGNYCIIDSDCADQSLSGQRDLTSSPHHQIASYTQSNQPCWHLHRDHHQVDVKKKVQCKGAERYFISAHFAASGREEKKPLEIILSPPQPSSDPPPPTPPSYVCPSSPSPCSIFQLCLPSLHPPLYFSACNWLIIGHF